MSEISEVQTKLTREQKESVGLLSVGTFLEYFDVMLGLSIQLCKFINKSLHIVLNSIVKFYQKVSHSFIPISNRHSPFCRNIIDCQV